MGDAPQNFSERPALDVRALRDSLVGRSDGNIERPVGTQRETPPNRQAILTAKAVLGFLIGFSGAFIIEFTLVYFLFSSDVRPVGLGWIMLPIAAGSATSAFFKKQDLGALFSRIAFGMNPRLPIAVYFSCSLTWVAYLFISEDSFWDWYDENAVRFWLVLFAAPTIVTAILIVFHWAMRPSIKLEN